MYGRTAAGLGVGLVLGVLRGPLLTSGYVAFGITILVISTLIVLLFVSTRRSGFGGDGGGFGGDGGVVAEATVAVAGEVRRGHYMPALRGWSVYPLTGRLTSEKEDDGLRSDERAAAVA